MQIKFFSLFHSATHRLEIRGKPVHAPPVKIGKMAPSLAEVSSGQQI